MNTIILIILAVLFLSWSTFKSREKTKESLILSKNLLIKTFIEIIGVMALVGLVLAILPPELIKQLLGNSNEFLSTLYGAIIGALTIIPAFIAFPLSKSLYQSGANLTAIAAFITTLTMVGFATIPIETKYFGKKFTLHRLWLSFVAAILIASGMAVIL
ncbi:MULTISPECIES: permease [unclassified Thermosipho (in: thermotogales)]|uniref:permease n=1 Tax=unclassified Thermosipho (in: thermotogales) TaxID=2676525 RepID=UPI00098760D3|nr:MULTISPECIES: permease [unclassified Thermosipho (in: thermotogales)]MBT1247084.1 permease [Thermosipho sp. 1244]OOC46862.1 permease [Thermosipho sp. 1223]